MIKHLQYFLEKWRHFVSPKTLFYVRIRGRVGVSGNTFSVEHVYDLHDRDSLIKPPPLLCSVLELTISPTEIEAAVLQLEASAESSINLEEIWSL